ncbi:hypothetical protein Pcinc_038798 [Petrolisthes cinctipes]|uniref:Uncharacterized protein n=1 Tax=Petrolisthes cinctipes TaxID=88211 RepID=A0AAE1BSQ7_PETCI|nr:hypothetical protein Pcinc_038798 [Petrolisthes cinctipes]
MLLGDIWQPPPSEGKSDVASVHGKWVKCTKSVGRTTWQHGEEECVSEETAVTWLGDTLSTSHPPTPITSSSNPMVGGGWAWRGGGGRAREQSTSPSPPPATDISESDNITTDMMVVLSLSPQTPGHLPRPSRVLPVSVKLLAKWKVKTRGCTRLQLHCLQPHNNRLRM